MIKLQFIAQRALHRIKTLRFKYSLKALFALTTVVSVVLAVRVFREQQYQHRLAAAKVLIDGARGINVEILGRDPRSRRFLGWDKEDLRRDEAVYYLLAPPPPLTDCEIAAIMCFPTLRILDLSAYTGLADAKNDHVDLFLAQISKLPLVEELNLRGRRVSDDGVRQLCRLRRLRVLNLSETTINGSGFEGFTALQSLEDLDLHDTNVDDNAMRHLAGVRSLRVLDLSNTNVTGAALQYLPSLTSLESLRLHGNEVPDASLSWLARLPKLKSFTVGPTGITDEGVKAIAELKSLEFAGICGKITDAGLLYLADMKSLRAVNIFGCRLISADGVAQLRAAKPGIVIAGEGNVGRNR